MNRGRDTQRSKFFKAWKAMEPFTTRMGEMKDVHSYLARLDRATLVRRYGDAVVFSTWPIDVRDGRGYSRATAHPSERWVTFPRGCRDTMSVLRAIAHIILYRQSGNGGRLLRYRDGSRRQELFQVGPWHGWRYCAVVLDLVRYVEGTKAAETLVQAFKQHGVRYTEPVTRKLTPSQKSAAQQRGVALAEQNRDRKARASFADLYPEAEMESLDLFAGDWEDIYRLWKP
jgi:hypothetical protein